MAIETEEKVYFTQYDSPSIGLGGGSCSVTALGGLCGGNPCATCSSSSSCNCSSNCSCNCLLTKRSITFHTLTNSVYAGDFKRYGLRVSVSLNSVSTDCGTATLYGQYSTDGGSSWGNLAQFPIQFTGSTQNLNLSTNINSNFVYQLQNIRIRFYVDAVCTTVSCKPGSPSCSGSSSCSPQVTISNLYFYGVYDKGTCCSLSASCSLNSKIICESDGSTFVGDDACSGTSCISLAPTGACCDSGCSITSEANCGGTWLGNGTVCSPDPCTAPPGTGACCCVGAFNNSCSITTEENCNTACLKGTVGTWLDGSACNPNPCGTAFGGSYIIFLG